MQEENKKHEYDAIVIGSGISGGWAAKELCEKGLKTLVLERGRDVKHVKDYPTINLMPWELQYAGEITDKEKEENPILSRCYNYQEDSKHFFADDKDHPYEQQKPFDWIRGNQVGGRSLLWARHTQRWSDFDFEGPARDGYAVDWPIRYKDIAPWYSYVEKFAGISGNKDGLDCLPDGEFLPPMELNCAEKYFKEQVARNYKNRHVIIGRCAHITETRPIYTQQGRVSCQHRDLCRRGCPFGGYFSSNASTLPWAERTGNLTLLSQAIVHSVIYDDKKGKATGVRVIDAQTKATTEYFASIIFINASAIATNHILLNSTSSRFPAGLGNDNGLLGKFIGFHNYRGRVFAEYDGAREFITDGRRPVTAYMPRFRNLYQQETSFLRGYAVVINGSGNFNPDAEWGEGLKKYLARKNYDGWNMYAGMMGETIPKATNTVSLSAQQKDQWGIPLLQFDVDYDNNDEAMLKDYFEQISEMFEKAGFKNIRIKDTKQAPGLDVHEMGGVRMGNDPKTSLLNKWNQLHSCSNVFVTDGACMTSTSTQNPSLTYMALTARAADYAVQELKKKNI
ncbi:MAG: GMC family oxidoreductase [Niabella sp.]